MVTNRTVVNVIFLLLLFGYQYSFRFLGIGDFNVFRDLLIVILLCICVASTWASTKSSHRNNMIVLILPLLLFVFFGAISSIQYFNAALSYAFLMRIIMMILLIFYFSSVRFSELDISKIFVLLKWCFVIYCAVSLASFPVLYSPQGAMHGLAGQHFSKFIFVISFCFFVSCLTESINKQGAYSVLDILGLIISLVCIYFVLQRGALLASFVGFSAIVFLAREIRLATKLLCSVAAIFALVGTLIYSPSVREYAFFDNVPPELLVQRFFDGNLLLSDFRTRGRTVFLGAILEKQDISFIGGGSGLIKNEMRSLGFYTIEPHNDILFLLIDFGYLGLFLFGVFALLFLYLTRRIYLMSTAYSSRVLLVTAAGAFSGFLTWMPASNVIIYLPYNFFPCLLMSLIVAAQFYNFKDCGKLDSEFIARKAA